MALLGTKASCRGVCNAQGGGKWLWVFWVLAGVPPWGAGCKRGSSAVVCPPHERPLWGHLILAYGNAETRSDPRGRVQVAR